jgi:hypothetical protein
LLSPPLPYTLLISVFIMAMGSSNITDSNNNKTYVQRFWEWFNENITKPARSMSAKDLSRSVR